MFVPSLLHFSSKAVAKYFVEGRYKNLEFSLGEPVSDRVFSEVLKTDYNWSSVIAKETGLELNLTSFDAYPFSHRDLENLQFHNIRSVVIESEEFCEDPEYTIGEIEGGEKILDIVRILKTCLNENSRQNLKKLHLLWCNVFPDDWIEKVAELLPSLRSFQCKFIDDEDFGRACHLFPNLVSFAPGFLNDRIGSLKNLQMLTLHDTRFHLPEQLNGLFELLNLRVLDVSCSERFFENLLLCEGTFQNLKFLECEESDIDETQVLSLVARYSSLKSIGLLYTSCEGTDFSDLPITVLNVATIESIMEALKHKLNETKDDETDEVDGLMDCLWELWYKKQIEDDVFPRLNENLFLRLMMKVTVKCPHLIRKQVIMCLILYYNHAINNQSRTNALQNPNPESFVFFGRQWVLQSFSNFRRGI
uniref:FBD domain-containing protein n=1 Tax=Caenorhabditis tropicalis TaxID=1561998 RepID=A0A1I7TVM0_9PELO